MVLEKWASIKTIPAAFVKWHARTRNSEDKAESLETHQPGSEPTPTWWYLVALGVSLGLGIFACEYYPVQLRWYGVLLAMVVSAVFFIPVSHNLQHCEPDSDIDLAVLGLCNNQRQDSNRHLLPYFGRLRLGGSGISQHLVL